MENLTLAFASRLLSCPCDSGRVLDMARLLVIDGLAVGIVGSGEPGPSSMARVSRDYACSPSCTVIGHGFASSPAQAARINGMSMHVLDYEPMWSPPNHAVSTILPALLALAEVREAAGAPPQGRRVLEALATGVEAQGRLRLSSGQLEPKALTLHPPGLVGPLASAAACGRLLGLDEQKLAMAIGIAASRAGGVLANVGSMTKALHCGDAAANGMEAALLAMHGFDANPDALAGPRGYGASYFSEHFDPSVLTSSTGAPRILDPGPAWKLFPSQYATHFAITAALACRTMHSDLAKVRRVVIKTPVMPYIDRAQPESGLDGKFSYQYCTAIALLDGHVNLTSFSDERRFAHDVVALLDRTHLVQSSDIPGRFDEMHVDVVLELVDGSVIEQRCDGPAGCWSRPVDPAAIRLKDQELFGRVLSDAQEHEFWEAVDRPVEALSIAEVLKCLSTRG